MTLHATPTLLNLAVQSLLKDETLAISALEDLPGDLFPPLFKEAFTSRQSKVLRAMVAAWPFPCLPLGSLMKTDDLETLQAVLGGCDQLLTLNVRPRRCKLQVLDLRNVRQNIWNMGTGVEDSCCPGQVTREKPAVEDHRGPEVKQPFTVLADLYLKLRFLEVHQDYLLQWALQRKSSLRLCCLKMDIWSLPVKTVIDIMKIVEPDSIEVLKLNAWWKLGTLSRFAPYLGQMRNLRKFLLVREYPTFDGPEEISPRMENCVTKFFCQFPKLERLQHLSMNGVYFLKGHLKQVLSSLKTPLETLWITQCCLSQDDLNYLPQCPVVIHQLKHLDLTGVILFHLCTKSLQILLETVSATLETLKLEDCRMGNSQFCALLPALSKCSQLTMVNFLQNNLSMSVLNDLLHHTASLSRLTVEMYPVPQEVYDNMGVVDLEVFGQICPQLMGTLRAIREPRSACFATDTCYKCFERCSYSQETKLCICWNSRL